MNEVLPIHYSNYNYDETLVLFCHMDNGNVDI